MRLDTRQSPSAQGGQGLLRGGGRGGEVQDLDQKVPGHVQCWRWSPPRKSLLTTSWNSCSQLPEEMRRQVACLAGDQPMVALLRTVDLLTELARSSSSTGVHLCIVWNIAFWRKGSAGQKAMCKPKSVGVDPATDACQWGALHKGHEYVFSRKPRGTREVLVLRVRLLDCNGSLGCGIVDG